MDYLEKIEKIVQENVTSRCFKLWKEIDKRLPNVWEKPTSSTGKYHKKLNGRVPSQAEHVYEMLYAASKLLSVFNIEKKTPEADKIFLAILLHDCLKYGVLGTRKHTDNSHDKLAADMICQNKDTFLKILNEQQFEVLTEMVRFHSGRWSTDVTTDQQFSFSNKSPETLFIHLLDMMSAADLIQTDIRS